MSDMHDQERPVDPEQSVPEATRELKPMPRHRSDRYASYMRPGEAEQQTPFPAEEQTEATENAAEAGTTPELGEDAMRQLPPASPVQRQIPQPAALRNAIRPAMPGGESAKKKPRKPVNASDYMRRFPLGKAAGRADSYDETPVQPAMRGHQTVQRPAAGSSRSQDAFPMARARYQRDNDV